MGVNTPHALARMKQFYAIYESTPFTPTLNTGTTAMRILESSFEPNIVREIVEETRLTRSTMERTTEKGTIGWSAKMLIRPSGAAGTAPDCDALLTAAMGKVTIVGSTSVTYEHDASQVLDTLTLMHHSSEVLQETVYGAIVDKLTIDVPSGGRPSFLFEGRAGGYGNASYGTLNGAVSASATIVLDQTNNFRVGGLIKVGTDDNSGSGFLIDTDDGAGTYTLNASVTSEADGAVVEAFVPTPTVAGTPASGTVGLIKFGENSKQILSANIVIENNNQAFEDVALEQYFTDAVPGYRTVTGKVQIRARRDEVDEYIKRDQFGEQAMTTIIGTTAGSILTISHGGEFKYEAIEWPADGGAAIINLPFECTGSGSGDDEVSLAFT